MSILVSNMVEREVEEEPIIWFIASLIAQGTEVFYAAVLGVYLHGLAADRLAAGRNLFGIMPRDIADEVTRIGLRSTAVE